MFRLTQDAGTYVLTMSPRMRSMLLMPTSSVTGPPDFPTTTAVSKLFGALFPAHFDVYDSWERDILSSSLAVAAPLPYGIDVSAQRRSDDALVMNTAAAQLLRELLIKSSVDCPKAERARVDLFCTLPSGCPARFTGCWYYSDSWNTLPIFHV